MMGPTHRLFGAFCGAAVAALAGEPWVMVAMTALVATSTSNGPTSPDLDQSEGWRTLTRALPSTLRKHRGLTHWPELPLLAWLLLGQLPPDARWPAYAVLIGWVSHLIGDAIFGYVPVLFGRFEVGLGLKTDGFVESGRARLFRRTRRVVPVSPARLALTVGLTALLIGGLPAGTQGAAEVFPAAANGAR